MLYTFQSRAASDVIFLEADGRQLLQLIGKDPDVRPGVLTVAQMPAAIAALAAAMAEESKQPQTNAAEPDDGQAEDEENDAAETVLLRQRVVPFIEWLQRSLAEGHDVMW
ncbi:DUF1840 domain-containing protein [Neisseriaceae bacterium CLB008]|nr:DUF1840 domain-containing protein [Neisseriaceae bacterium]